ncbi:amidase [Halomicroarcula sp. GCM10025324]|uniref:amidase n=1 Tax=Haloarcula TaxID=2237 RepID=UPI0023E8C21C|nr:amidase [Halomicroarcula sp. ZS-22-S1]
MTPSFDPLETTVAEIHEAMQDGEVTSRELVDWYLDRIDAYDRDGPTLNSVVTVNEDARARAAELDEALADRGLVGPLHGIPVLVKDQAETAGLRTTFGSAVFDDYVPETDATVVKELKEAGAIVLAKTNLCDWAASWFGYSSAIGRTKNPYVLDRDPGGSSAGTGAGVAANLGVVGIGEDTGGSVRLPAGYCNLFGMRVTTGLVSRTGFSPLVTRQDTPGPMTRTAADLARLLDTITGYDDTDGWTGANAGVADQSFTEALDPDALDGARIGVLRQALGDESNPESAPVTAVFEDALSTLEDAGATLVDPVSIPDLDQQLDDTSLYVLQSKHDINEFLDGRANVPADSVADIAAAGGCHELVSDLFTAMLDGPADPSAVPEYWEGVGAQGRLQRDILQVHAEHDLDAIVFPDAPVLPPTEQQLRDGTYSTMGFPTNTVIASQSGCPAVSVPGGLTDDGVPVGLELMGVPYDDHALVALASAYDQVADTREPPATVLSDD